MQGAVSDWDKWLPLVQLSLNVRILERTKSRPFELMFGRPFNDFKDFHLVDPLEDPIQAVGQRLETLKELRDLVYPAMVEVTANYRKGRASVINDNNKLLTPLQPGERVMIVDVTKGNKWMPGYEGPFTIFRQTRGGAYVLLDHDGTKLKRKFPIHLLKIVDGVPSGGGKEEEEHFVVDHIVDHRPLKNGIGNQYQVRWKGFNQSEDTWDK